MNYSVFKRNNGNYYLKITDNGKIVKRISTGTNKKSEAIRFLKEFELSNSKTIDKKIYLRTAAKEFITYKKHLTVNRYHKQIEQCLDRFQKELNNPLLAQINKRTIESFLFKITDSFYFRALNYRILKSFFNWLISNEYISLNPCNKIRLPKTPEKVNIFVTMDQFEQILKHEPNQLFKDIYTFAFYSGMRLNEIINCRLNWIDLEAKIITIQNDSEFQTKSKRIRQIPINNKLNEVIIRNFPKILSINQDEFLFDFPIVDKKQYISKRFKDSVKIVFGNDSKIHFHNLRGSYGSELIKRGANISTVSKLLGHYSISVTEKHYISIQQEELKRTANLLD